MNQVAKFLGWIVLRAGGAIYVGFIIATMWKWFVTTAFALPLISIPEGIGLAIFVGLFDSVPSQWDVEHAYSQGMSFTIGIAIKTLGLAFGWAVHLFL